MAKYGDKMDKGKMGKGGMPMKPGGGAAGAKHGKNCKGGNCKGCA